MSHLIYPRKHTIAVIGPHGNATHSLIQVDTGRVCPTNNRSTMEVDFDCVKQPIEAISDYNKGGQTYFSPGASLAKPYNTSLIKDAVETAQKADVIILGLGIVQCGDFLGDSTYPFSHCSGDFAKYAEAEAHDRYAHIFCPTMSADT